MEGISMKEQWIDKAEMLDLLDTVLDDLEAVERKISFKLDEVVSLYEQNQQQALQSVEHALIDIQKVTAELQDKGSQREWKSKIGEAVLRPI
jgi:hypothetical protein